MASSRRIILVQANAVADWSGGQAYNRHIVAALRRAGHDVVVTSPANVTIASTADDIMLIDGQILSSVPTLAMGAIGLIHHPASGPDIAASYVPLAHIITTSTLTAERLTTEFAVPATRISVVPPGSTSAPRSIGTPITDPIQAGSHCAILSIGKLAPRKSHDLLLRALARLMDLDWQLTLVGTDAADPAHAASLYALAEQHGMTARVRFVAEGDDAMLATLWQSTDLFALASRWEASGVLVAEAFRHGVPVCVTSGGLLSELVTPESGSVAAPEDTNHFSKLLRRMIFDTPLRRGMADGAWAIGETLPSWDQRAAEFAACLTGLTKP